MNKNRLLQQMIDYSTLQSLFESFHALCGVPLTITDIDGNLLYTPNGDLLAAGGIRVCTHYHRQCEQTKKNCIISDIYLSRLIKSGEKHAIYKCLNGLVDLAVPIHFEGELIGNLFSGQFFMEKPDMNYYESLADKYSFDKTDYLQQIAKVQLFDQEKVNHIIQFLKALARQISDSFHQHQHLVKPVGLRSSFMNLPNVGKKRNEILTTTLLSLQDYIYSLNVDDCFESYYTPFKVGLLEDHYDNIKGRHYSELHIGETLKQKLGKALKQTKKERKAVNFNFSLDKNGHQEQYKATVSCRRDAFNHFGGSTLHIRNITYEANAFEDIKKLMHIIDHSPVAIVITNDKAEIEYVNECFVKNSGYSREEVMGKNPRFLKSGATPQSTYDNLWQKISHGESWNGCFQNKRKDGSFFSERCMISPFFSDGTISHFVAIKEDITEKLILEKELLRYKNKLEERVVEKSKALQQSQHDYKEIVEHLTGIIWEVDMKGYIRFASPNISRFSEFSSDELIGQSIATLFDPELHGKLFDFIAHFPNEPKEFSDFELFLDKGKKRNYLKASGKPIFSSNGELIGIRGISMDVSQQKERDKAIVEAIWRAEESLRTRISMELHDSIGATMSALSMYLNTLNTQIPNNELLQQVDQIVKNTASDIRMVARELNPPELKTLGLSESLKAICLLYGQMEHINIKFYTDHLLLEPEQDIKLAIYRIITELISNAIKHGQATDIHVRLFNYDDEIYLLYEDIGRGVFSKETTESNAGNGIKNILTRLKTYGGHCQFFPLPNCGLVVGMQLKSKT